MPIRAFAVEDGNTNVKSVAVARKRTYSDVDLTFATRPDKDIFRKSDAAAVKQSVKTILLTNFTEKPFLPSFGANLYSFLFSLDTDIEENEVKQDIITALEDYEPRADVLDIRVTELPEQHDVSVTVTFRVISTNEVESVDLSLTRLR